MDGKVRRLGTLLVALGCAAMSLAYCAHECAESAQKPALTNDEEYASTRADGSGNSAAPGAPVPAAGGGG